MAQKRAIFQEVAAGEAVITPGAAIGAIDRGRTAWRGAIRVWLQSLFLLVVLMIAVGGATRLTDSGLSITEWRPVTGALPPLSAEEWQLEFDKYREIPEYQLQNKGMSLAEFKVIYWWEWGHRQLGRFIGLVWGLGFFTFLALRRIPTGWTGRLLLLGAFGGLQGAIGWWMVASGLTGTMVDVASYRLATHLGLAFVILGLIAWNIVELGRTDRDLIQARRAREPGLRRLGTILCVFTFVQILLGAFVAGIDAGRAYTDWPLMSGGFFPPNMWDFSPVWRNFFENSGLVQFIHRTSGYLLLLFGLYTWYVSRRSPNQATRRAFDWATLVLFSQMIIGIVTLINAAPVTLALMHQFCAVVLWVLVLRARFLTQYPMEQSVRGGARA
ncbi:MAG: heme A synthase [Pseudomonadota bacterium]